MRQTAVTVAIQVPLGCVLIGRLLIGVRVSRLEREAGLLRAEELIEVVEAYDPTGTLRGAMAPGCRRNAQSTFGSATAASKSTASAAPKARAHAHSPNAAKVADP